MLIKGGIEDKIRKEYRDRAAIRRQEDVLKGLSRAKGAQRGDFNETKKYDKLMYDYRRFKSPQDREKIKKEYFGMQYERRGI